MTKSLFVTLLTISILPATPLTAAPSIADPRGTDAKKTTLEASREFSGKPFSEMQNKAREVKLDVVIQPAKSAPLKLSTPSKRAALGSTVKKIPEDMTLEEMSNSIQQQHTEVLSLAKTLTITGIGALTGTLIAGIPGGIICGTATYLAWKSINK